MERVRNDIKNSKFHNFYLFYGTEEYLKQQYRNDLLKALVKENDTMNFSRYQGADLNVSSIIDVAETLPFFADYRVILIEGSGLFHEANEALADYMEHCCESTVFIFVESAVDRRGRCFKNLSKYGIAVSCEMPTEAQLKQWVIGRLKREGKTISGPAYAEFFKRTFSTMENMATELEKVISYVGDRGEVTAEDIRAVCIEQIESRIFDMIDAMGQKNPNQVMAYYRDMLASREAPVKILILVERQFRQILCVAELSANHISEAEISSRLKLAGFVVRKNLAVARTYSIPQIRQLLADAEDLEYKIKTGGMADTMAVELLILKYSKRA